MLYNLYIFQILSNYNIELRRFVLLYFKFKNLNLNQNIFYDVYNHYIATNAVTTIKFLIFLSYSLKNKHISIRIK